MAPNSVSQARRRSRFISAEPEGTNGSTLRPNQQTLPRINALEASLPPDSNFEANQRTSDLLQKPVGVFGGWRRKSLLGLVGMAFAGSSKSLTRNVPADMSHHQ